MSNSLIAEAFAALDEDRVIKLVEAQIGNGVDPLVVVKELQAGMQIFSDSCRQGEFFIADLILAGEIFQQAMQRLTPLLSQTRLPAAAKIILGTVKGDIHNLGKDILSILLQASGFEVIDLGINVAPQTFVEKARETGTGLIGLSGLITPSFEAMKDTVSAFQTAGMRSSVKIIIGGGVVNQMVQEYTGADASSTDAMEGVALFQQLAGGDKR